MEKEILLDMVAQNKTTCGFAFGQLNEGNSHFRLTEQTASAGFIYRHIGETMNLFGAFFDLPSDVENTTLGEVDSGREYDLAESAALIEKGFAMLERLIESSSPDDWMKPVETPFFGRVSRARLLAHVLYHTSSHAGQISMTLAKGSAF